MYSIGLDIGIASVGWSVIDGRNGHIDDLGVRLFSARNSDNNADRRGFRSGRRLIRRRATRLNDSKKILNEIGIIEDPEIKNACPYELRVKGLSEQLSKGEIYKVVNHIVKKRGISYLDEDAEDAKSEGQDYKAQVNNNTQLLKTHTPGEIQLQRLKENGRVKTGINPKGEYQLNVFTVQAYANELERILKEQQKYYPEITDDFISTYVGKGIGEEAGLVHRKRPYYHGPGNKHNNSEYGRWADYKLEGKPADNIFDKLIGKDLLGKLRASTSSLTAQKYNLLNDLNNLTIKRENPKLTLEEKTNVLNYLMNENATSFGTSHLVRLLDLSMKDIKGWRLDNKGKPEIHNMKAYRAWRKIFNEENIELNDVPTEIIDEIAKIITLNTEVDAAMNTIDLELKYLDSKIRKLINDRFHDLRKNKGAWHSFSLSTMEILIPELLNTSEEQNTILERLGIKKDLRGKYSSLNKIPVEEIVEQIFNPTVSKSVRQALKVFNELINRYGKENISHVTIEMPRDKNEDDQKKTIADIQKNNAERKRKSEQYFLDKSGWDTTRFEFELRKKSFASKLNYYYEQDGKCAYTGLPLSPEDLISNATEIDHIIPLSISLDDSINNKVLVKASANQEKGQRSPYQAFMDNANLNRSWDEYIAWVESRKYKKYKKALLLETRDIFDPEVHQSFVARNLNDTRYSSRTVLNVLQSYFYETETKVKVITGNFTHTLRKKWGKHLEKTRETDHHHAVDATLCAVTPFVTIDRFEYHIDEEGKKYMVDTQTGELIPYNQYKKMNVDDRRTYVPEWQNFIGKLEPIKIHPRIKFSHQVDRKWNRKVSDATLYSTRKLREEKVNKKGKVTVKEDEYIVGKIKDIYTVDGWKAFKKNKDKLLMKELDPQTYEKLVEIASSYPESEEVEQADGKIKKVDRSPFRIYCDEHQIPAIQKYSKKGNGPIIRSVKFYDKKLGNHINITKDSSGNSVEESKYNKKVVLTSLNPWRTDVYYSEEKDAYELLGIKYNHLKFIDSEYGVPIDIYDELKKEEKISADSVFCFSLYRKDLIRIEFEDQLFECLYHSRTLSNRNYFEVKPIHKTKWDNKENLNIFGNVSSGGRFVKSLKPHMKISKIRTDILGNKYLVKNEELKGIIK